MNTEKTIYDVIPTIEKELVKLLEAFLKADGGKFHLWEMAVFNPGCNAFIHNMSGVNEALRSDNYISAITNFRSAMESLAAIVYDGTAKFTNEEYTRFLKKGRFYKKRDGKWVEVGPRAMINNAEKVLGIKMVKIYDECSSMVHFSSEHMSFLGRFTYRNSDNDDRTMKILIGSKDKIPADKQKELVELTTELATCLGKCIVAATDEKERRSGAKG